VSDCKRQVVVGQHRNRTKSSKLHGLSNQHALAMAGSMAYQMYINSDTRDHQRSPHPQQQGYKAG